MRDSRINYHYMRLLETEPVRVATVIGGSCCSDIVLLAAFSLRVLLLKGWGCCFCPGDVIGPSET